MTEEQIISWIFLAIALATNTEPSDINGISMVADGINHAVPTQKELQISIAWLTNKGLILKNGKRYELTNKGKLEYEAVSKNSDKLLAIWKHLEIKLGNYEK